MAIPIVQAAGTRIVGATERVRYALPGEQIDGGAAQPVVLVTDADIAAGRASMPAAAISASVRFVADRRVEVGTAQSIYIQNDPPLIRPEDVSGGGGVWYADQRTYTDSTLSVAAGVGSLIGGWAPVAGTLPAFSASGTARPARTVNGIVFDGSSDVMSYTGNTLMNAASRTVIAVVSAPAATATQGLFSSANANWYVGQTGSAGVNGRMLSSWQDATATQRTSNGLPADLFDSKPHVYAWRFTTSGSNVTVDHWRDLEAVASASRTDGMNATAHSTWYLGAFSAASLFGAWTIRALAIYPFALSESQRRGILAYWQIIYGLV